MANPVSSIQSLKAVDAWIDVINANINGGVRTAFKSSRLRFAGSNTQLDRPATASTLPLQFPEPSLITANTVIDFTQGAITSSTETSHLAIQGDNHFFLLASPDMIDTDPASATFGSTLISATARMLLTRDGEFHTDAAGFLRHSSGYYAVTIQSTVVGGTRVLRYAQDPAHSGLSTGLRAVFNDLDITNVPTVGGFTTLSNYLTGQNRILINGNPATNASLFKVESGHQHLRYSQFGSTVYDFGWRPDVTVATPDQFDDHIKFLPGVAREYTLLSKSLEASNSSMTQSVPELSLAQKLFSALTKVIQIHQTNIDSVLNTIR